MFADMSDDRGAESAPDQSDDTFLDHVDDHGGADGGLDLRADLGVRERRGPADARADLEAFMDKNKSQSAVDLDDAPVFLGKTAWEIGYVQDKNPKVRFTATKERAG